MPQTRNQMGTKKELRNKANICDLVNLRHVYLTLGASKTILNKKRGKLLEILAEIKPVKCMPREDRILLVCAACSKTH